MPSLRPRETEGFSQVHALTPLHQDAWPREQFAPQAKSHTLSSSLHDSALPPVSSCKGVWKRRQWYFSNTSPMAWNLWGFLMSTFHVKPGKSSHFNWRFHILLPCSLQPIPFQHHFQPFLSKHPSSIHSIFLNAYYMLTLSMQIWFYQRGPPRRGGQWTFIKGFLWAMYYVDTLNLCFHIIK